ncbi:hypothetical protein [Streptomyces puniciscabiei]|uniref:hypothetical protein n=1 Tax=Streptomyces puniciscabiei TaxID=164348 RepID=UPI00331F4A3E
MTLAARLVPFRCLRLLTLTEAHQQLDVLQYFGMPDHDWGAQARHFAAELAARVPSRDA